MEQVLLMLKLHLELQMQNQQIQMFMQKCEVSMGMPKPIMMIKAKIQYLQSLEEFQLLVKLQLPQLMLSQELMKELFGKLNFISRQRMIRLKKSKKNKELKLLKHNRRNNLNKIMKK